MTKRTTLPVRLSWILAAILMASESTATAQTPALLKKVGFDQRLNAQVPLDLEFVDETGKAVRLGDYFGQKPVILVLAYYKCPMLCTLVLNGLVQAMHEIPFEIGKEFNVVTSVSIRTKPPNWPQKRRHPTSPPAGKPAPNRDGIF
jgi:cytochrome oxidase Cu insertion factor (SCO1/SenC/PrrC family)